MNLRLLSTIVGILLFYFGNVQGQQLSITSVTPNPVCANSTISVTYSYTAGDAGTLLVYLNGPGTVDVIISAASVAGGNGSLSGVIPASRATGTYTVRLVRISSTPSGNVNSLSSLGFTVNALPSAPGVSNVAHCLGATGVPALIALGQNLQWYPNSSGGGGTTIAPTPPTSTAGTTSYYVSQTVNGCQGPRATQQVTINPLPAKPTVVSSLSYCQNTSTPSLAAAVTSGSNLKWYTSSLGGIGSTVAPTPSTTGVGLTTYFVSQTNFGAQTDGSGCESERAEITVTVKAAPAAPSATTPVVYCQNAGASPLSATGVPGSILNWFGTSNNALGNTVPTPPTTAPGTTFYSVSQTVNGCEGPKATTQVTVNTRPAAPTTRPVSVCQNTTPVSLATGVTSGTNLRWYTNSSGGTGSSVAPAPPTSTIGQTPYYVSLVNDNGCESDRAVITFVVNGYPSAPTVNPSTLAYCQNEAAVPLTATATTGATLNFYLGPNGGTRYVSLTPSTSSSNNYYVSQTLNGCEGQRTTIAVSVRSLPPSPTVTIPSAYCQFVPAVALSATASTNFSLAWYGTNASGGTFSTVASTPSTNNTGNFHYYVSQRDPFGCESVRADIPVTINAKPTVPATTSATACLNSEPNSLALSVTATGTLNWYTDQVGGTGSSVPPTLSTAAVETSTYYVSQKSGDGCESDRGAITFTVNPLPPAPTVASPSLSLCQNSVATPLTATGSNLKWYKISTGGTALPNPVIPSTAVAGPPVEYYVSQTNANGCESLRTNITVVVSTPGLWVGIMDSNWDNPANWSCGTLPTDLTDVVIGASGNTPEISVSGPVCRDLTILSGASLLVSGHLSIYGNFTNNGIMNAPGKISFSGGVQLIPGGTYGSVAIEGSGIKTLSGNVKLSETLSFTNSYLQLGEYDFLIEGNGNITGYDKNGFIITNGKGRLRKNGLGISAFSEYFTFPVGTSSGSYTPLMLKNTGVTDTFGVSIINGISSSYDTEDNASGTPLSGYNVNKTWLVAEGHQGGSIATLMFQWTAQDEQSGFLRGNSFPAHYYDGQWHRQQGAFQGEGYPYSIALSGITRFSPFGIGSAGSALPLKLLSFSAVARENNVDLAWETSFELNTARFEIEASADALHFMMIGKVAALNSNSAERSIYQFDAPYTKSGSASYYRLKMIDQDGSFSYSKIQSVRNSDTGNGFLVFPNPVQNQYLNVKSIKSQTGSFRIIIYDAAGRLQYLNNIKGSDLSQQPVQIPMNDLIHSGNYILNITESETGNSQRIQFFKK